MHLHTCKCVVDFYNGLKSIRYSYIIITVKKKYFSIVMKKKKLLRLDRNVKKIRLKFKKDL